MDRHELNQLLAELRSAVRAGASPATLLELIDRLEPLGADLDAMRSRLERGPSPLSPTQPSSPERLEAWIRKLERSETTTQ
jgi:hypothetical protein